MTRSALTQEVIEEIKALPTSELRELRVYVSFLKARHVISPEQAYFWTKQWQVWERQTEQDKRKSRLIGDGTLRGLIAALKRR